MLSRRPIPGGQGSLGIVERLFRGWRGKTLILILLGFAATDFTMLKTLSLADASVHVLNKHEGLRREGAKQVVGWVKNCTDEYCGPEIGLYIDEQLIVTIVLGIVGYVFWFILRKGFSRNVMILAVPIVVLYLLLTGILIARRRLDSLSASRNRHRVDRSTAARRIGPCRRSRTATKAGACWRCSACWHCRTSRWDLSGFELSMILMPQVQGQAGEQPPKTRICNTRKVLIAAAVIMSVFLLGSVLVTTLLIPPEEFAQKRDGNVPREGYANNRALSYLAHGGTTQVCR